MRLTTFAPGEWSVPPLDAGHLPAANNGDAPLPPCLT